MNAFVRILQCPSRNLSQRQQNASLKPSPSVPSLGLYASPGSPRNCISVYAFLYSRPGLDERNRSHVSRFSLDRQLEIRDSASLQEPLVFASDAFASHPRANRVPETYHSAGVKRFHIGDPCFRRLFHRTRNRSPFAGSLPSPPVPSRSDRRISYISSRI